MRIQYQVSVFAMTLCLLFSGYAAGAVRCNPASTRYVDRAVEVAGHSVSGLQAGHGILIDNGVISVIPDLEIGDFYQGGIVFYLDETKRHGLAVGLFTPTSATGAASVDFSGPAPSGTASQLRLTLLANGIGAGATNTATMNAFQSASCVTAADDTCFQTAGPVVSAYTADALTGVRGCTLPRTGRDIAFDQSQCIGDWYLGSSYEWLQLAENIIVVNAAIQNLVGEQVTDGTNYWVSNTPNIVGTTNNAYFIDNVVSSPLVRSGQPWNLAFQTRAMRQF